jgi:hypothetical protein
MCTKSMVCFSFWLNWKKICYVFFFYSQNQGGCAVQSNAARCWCPDSYQGYYCQYSMFQLRENILLFEFFLRT